MSELEDALKQQWDYSVNEDSLKFKFSFEWEDGKQMGPFRGYLVANEKRNTDTNNYKEGTSFSEWLENLAIRNGFKQPDEKDQYLFDFGVKVKAAEKTDIATFISDLEMLYEDVPSDELKQYIEDLKLLLE